MDRATHAVLRSRSQPARITGDADLEEVEFDIQLLTQRLKALGHGFHEMTGLERPLVVVDAQAHS